MTKIYQLGLLGKLAAGTVSALTATIAKIVSEFGLQAGVDISIDQGAAFAPDITPLASFTPTFPT